jgi:NADH-quinone oxidoreductase subunit L
VSVETGIWLILFPIIGALIVPLIDRFNKKITAWYSLVIALITFLLSLVLIWNIQAITPQGYPWIYSLGVFLTFRLDALGVYVAAVAAGIGFLVILYSTRYMVLHAEEKGYGLAKYYALTLLFIGSMIGLALSDTIILVYIFWELVGFCSYALIAYYFRDPKAVRGGTKAFIITRIGDTGFFIAILALWIGTKTTSLAGMLASPPPDGMLLAIAGAGVLLAAIGKSAQFPLHVWLPDAMEAPTPISALIHAATMVNAGVYLVARTYPLFSGISWWPTAVVLVGALTALITAFLALTESDLKRVLAYSTSSQLGFMLSAAGAGAILACEFHLVSHAIFKALLFLCAGAVIQSVGTRNMYEMGGLSKKMRITNLAFLLGMLALAGIPVLNGFWSKDLVIESVFTAGFAWAGVILVITALMTVLYSWRMYYLVFCGTARTERKASDPLPGMAIPLIVLAIAAAVSWILIGPFSQGLAASLTPSYQVHGMTLFEMIGEVLFQPVVLISAASIVILAYCAFVYRERMLLFLREDKGFVRMARRGFWIDQLYEAIAGKVRQAGKYAGFTQTGDVNNNLAGLALGGVAVLIALLAWGGGVLL